MRFTLPGARYNPEVPPKRSLNLACKSSDIGLPRQRVQVSHKQPGGGKNLVWDPQIKFWQSRRGAASGEVATPASEVEGSAAPRSRMLKLCLLPLGARYEGKERTCHCSWFIQTEGQG